MIRTIAIVLVVCAAGWFGWLRVQQKYNVPAAKNIIAQKIAEIKSIGYDRLAEMAGSGQLVENVTSGGRTFPVKYSIEKVSGAPQATLKISGRVECITLVPFTGTKTGPGFEVLFSKDMSYREAGDGS